MKTIAIVLLIAATCQAQNWRRPAPQPTYTPPRSYTQSGYAGVFDPNRKIDGHHDHYGKVMYNAERMAELPTGQNKLALWVVLSPNWRSIPHEYAIASALSNDPRLKHIKANTQFNYYESNNPLFRESGLVEKVGTATPIVCLTAPDGKIMADGSAGMFVNAKSCPKTGGELADMLVSAIASFNPPPVVEGQTDKTPLVREMSVEQCGPDGCQPTPNYDSPPSDGTLTPILPRRPFSGKSTQLAVYWGAAALLAGGAVALRKKLGA